MTGQLTDGPAVLRDGDGAQLMRVDDTHRTRYIEVFLAAREASTGNLVAACYNPLFVGEDLHATRDLAPQELVEGIDFDQLTTDHGLLGASLNGPKIWTPSWMEAEVGRQRVFNGIRAAWVAQLDMTKAGAVADTTPYEPVTIARKSRLGWDAGVTVMVLDDAEGGSWVMKGFQLGLEPRFAYDDFVTNGASYFANLPPGWRFRVRTLEEDLVETPEDGVATTLADEFFNVYDRSGPGQMNYQA